MRCARVRTLSKTQSMIQLSVRFFLCLFLSLTAVSAFSQTTKEIVDVENRIRDDLAMLDQLLEVTKSRARAKQLALKVVREPFRFDFAEERVEKFYPPLDLDDFLHGSEDEQEGKNGKGKGGPGGGGGGEPSEDGEEEEKKVGFKEFEPDILINERDKDSLELLSLNLAIQKVNSSIEVFARQLDNSNAKLYQGVQAKTYPTSRGEMKFTGIIGGFYQAQEALSQHLSITPQTGVSHHFGLIIDELIKNESVFYIDHQAPELQEIAMERDNSRRLGKNLKLPKNATKASSWATKEIDRLTAVSNRAVKAEIAEQLEARLADLDKTLQEAIELNAIFKEEEKENLRVFRKKLKLNRRAAIAAFMAPPTINPEPFEMSSGKEDDSGGLIGYEMVLSKSKWKSLSAPGRLLSISFDAQTAEFYQAPNLLQIPLAVSIEGDEVKLENTTTRPLKLSSPYTFKWDSDQLVSYVGNAEFVRIKEIEFEQLKTKMMGPTAPQGQVSSTGKTPAGARGSSSDWPRFRGADGTGISPDQTPPSTWPSEGPPQLWTFSDAGSGYSSFAIVGNKLYTMGTRDEQIHLICLNIANGAEIWSTPFAEDDTSRYSASWGQGPRGTPTVSGGFVYGLGPTGTLVCLNALNGTEKWKKHLVDDFTGQPGAWGYAESPLVDGDRLIICPGGKQAGIVALDKLTGETVWAAKDVQPGRAEYSSAIAASLHGKAQYIRLFQRAIYGVDSATGQLLWEAPFPEGRIAVVPDPIVAGDRLFATAGHRAGTRCYQITPDWSVTSLWQSKGLSNSHGGMILMEKHLYGFDDKQGLTCLTMADGQLAWTADKPKANSHSSIVAIGGHLVSLDESDGSVSLIRVSSDTHQPLSQFTPSPQSAIRHTNGKHWTHPVALGGKLYLRDQDLIYCYGLR